jgi:hypothetical protein
MIGMLMVLALSQGQDFTWSGAIGEGKRLTVKNVIGDVRIEAASGGTASVTGTKRAGSHGNPEDVVIRRTETREGVVVCVLYPGQRDEDGDCDQDSDSWGGRHNRNDTRVDFVVRLPAGVHLDAGTVSGDVTGRGLRGDIEVHSVSGNVALVDVTGDVVEAQTVSGDVELSGIQASEVAAETVSGDVTFSGAVRPKGNYDLKTLSGDVVMQVPPGSGAEITGATFSGSFTSSFPLTTRATSKYTSQKRINGTIGDGSARIRVESFSGDVELRSAKR